MFNHFIFDIDGTLLDTEKTGVLSLLQTIKELTGKEVSYEEAYSYFGIPSAAASRSFGVDETLFAETWETHFQELMHLVTVFPGVEETLIAIKTAGKHLGIVTSRNKFELNYDPHMREWMKIFDCVVCSDDTEKHKPDPEPVLYYMKTLGASKEECIYIGDTLHDAQCGQGAGIAFGLADWRGRGLQGIKPEYYITSAKDILDLI